MRDMFVNWTGGGHFVNPDYESGGFSNEPGKTSQVVTNQDLWIQYRIKISTSRFDPAESTGKIMLITGNYANCRQELVQRARIASWGRGYYDQYTNVGNGVNSDLENPQESQIGGSLQPGGNDPGTAQCVVGEQPIGIGTNVCWSYPTDEWITMMVHIKPGHQIVDTTSTWYSGSANDVARDTMVEVFAARDGDPDWTTVVSYDQWIWWFSGDYIGGQSDAQPFGFNWLNLTAFNGGNDPVPAANYFYHRFDEIICSTQPIPRPLTGQLPNAPSWFTSMNDNTWAQIPATNTLQDVLTSVSGQNDWTTAWNGASVDQDNNHYILANNGGHGNGSSNAAYYLDLKAESPTWIEALPPSAQAGATDSNDGWDNYTAPDGQPRSCHGWNAHVWGNGRFVLTSMQGMATAGTPSSACMSLNWPNPTAWVDHGVAFPNVYGTNFEASPGCYDPIDNNFWGVYHENKNGGLSCWSIDGDTFAFTLYEIPPDPNNGPLINWVVCIPEDRYLLAGGDWSGGVVNPGFMVLDLTNPSAGWTARPFTGTQAMRDDGTHAVYHAGTKAFYTWDSIGSSVWKCSVPADGDFLNGDFVWSTVTAGAGSASPPSVGNGPFSKFNIVDDMGNGQAALVLLTQQALPTYIYKLPVA
jgi:hypothetical protein